jgi:two-component system, cell cycle sensor histidine kinase and response regulator CckA
VTTCATGEEAVRKYLIAKQGNNPFSFVIMDLTIPGGMGGRESAEDILALDPCARLIASSGYSNDPVMANFSDYGFCGSIIKPYTLDDLTRILLCALEHEQAMVG